MGDLLRVLLWYCSKSSPSCRCNSIIVGGETECRAAVGLAPTASQADLYTALDSLVASIPNVWRRRTDLSFHDVCALWRKHVRFLTSDEYEAEIGAEQLARGTKPHPYNGPAV